MLYDRESGEADIYGENGERRIDRLMHIQGWRNTWDEIVVGDFLGNDCQQLLLYDRNAGEADVVGFDGSGNMSLDTTNRGLGKSWNNLVAL